MMDKQAEQALLGAALFSKTARIKAKRIVTPDDFYDPRHGLIFSTMLALDRAGKSVDHVTLRAALNLSGSPVPEDVLRDIVTTGGVSDSAVEYASIVRRWAVKRRISDEARRIVQQAEAPQTAPDRVAAEAVTRFTAIRDHGTDVTALTLGEILDGEDDTPRWVIPGLLEAGDRLILTGNEGAGKSVLSRQLAIMAAAGMHPFSTGVIPPIKAVIVDCENKPGQVRRGARPLVEWITGHANATDPTSRVLIETPGRIDITRDRDLARLHLLIDAIGPDLVVLGPLYRMADRQVSTDDEAGPFLAALDTITARGCSIVLEAHAGHAKDGEGRKATRSLRPRGSSALLGWPEFGLGLRALGGGIADLEPWRGGREARDWPTRLRRAPGRRWVETAPDEQPSNEYPDDPQAGMW